jgi:two-component system response regulator AlgR
MTPLRVVIVDDEQPARSRLRELLDDCRAELPLVVAGEAENGIEGLDLIPAAEAELALVDKKLLTNLRINHKALRHIL